MSKTHKTQALTTSAGLLWLTVFVAGAGVMVYELLGSRIMAPYFGATLYTWSTLIGLILGSLALGYWLGGIWADKGGLDRKLSGLFLAIGGYLLVASVFKDSVLGFFQLADGMPFVLRGILGAAILFVIPSVAMGMVSPIAVRVALKKVETGGKTVGVLSGISTLGGIVGTFAAGFWLIPSFGTTETLLGLGITFVVLGCFWKGNRWAKVILVALAILSVLFAKAEKAAWVEAGIHDFDTAYSRFWVLPAQFNGHDCQAFYSDRYAVYSLYDPEAPDELIAPYVQMFESLRRDFVGDGTQKLAVVGGAGYIYPTWLVRNVPDAQVDAIEIDPQMWPVAERFFGAKANPRLHLFSQDCRNFFRDPKTEGKYDMVFFDVFNGVFVPFHTATKEAFADIEHSLTDKGVLAINLVDGPDSPEFMPALAATLKVDFPYVYIFNHQSATSEDPLVSYSAVASKQPLDLTGLDLPEDSTGKWVYVADLEGAKALTDNYAPVDSLLQAAL